MELAVDHTHGIGLWPDNRLIAHSSGRGWRNVHAALATVNSWSGTLAPTGHPCIAYCVNRPAHLRRRLGTSGRHETRTVQPRQFITIPGHEATDWHRHGSSDMLMLYIRSELIEEMAQALSSHPTLASAVDLGLGTTDPLLEQIALTVLRLISEPELGTSALYVESLVNTLVLHVLQKGDANGPVVGRDAAIFRRIVDFIEASLGRDLTVAALANEAGMGLQTFSRKFASTFGATVHQYVLSRRLEKAKLLLAGTDTPIVEVALRCGFANQSHLAMAFKKATGLSPKAFRR